MVKTILLTVMIPVVISIYCFLGCSEKTSKSIPQKIPSPASPVARYLNTLPDSVQREAQFYLVSIGIVRREMTRDGDRTFLILKDKYAPGLAGLEKFSHIMVFFWFDRNDSPDARKFLQEHREGTENPKTGVFAMRAAARPNLIGFTTCRIIAIKKNVVEIEDIDAFNDTPILDLKPYIPRNDAFPEASTPDWTN